ncbi:MAG: hypothetical protein KME27_00445 [Lyngbya sp. HA4199-MV5]|nr:hypothetical protein [Lyngbya sp. HA4199-MV5]
MTLYAAFNVKATLAVTNEDDAGSQGFVLPVKVVGCWLLVVRRQEAEGRGQKGEDKG